MADVTSTGKTLKSVFFGEYIHGLREEYLSKKHRHGRNIPATVERPYTQPAKYYPGRYNNVKIVVFIQIFNELKNKLIPVPLFSPCHIESNEPNFIFITFDKFIYITDHIIYSPADLHCWQCKSTKE